MHVNILILMHCEVLILLIFSRKSLPLLLHKLYLLVLCEALEPLCFLFKNGGLCVLIKQLNAALEKKIFLMLPSCHCCLVQTCKSNFFLDHDGLLLIC